MATTWSLTLSVQSHSSADTKALGDALTTDEEIIWSSNNESFTFQLHELKAKDLRAMWNTRMRGLMAVDSLLSSLVDKSEGSSTKTE
jgi:hypothetical protein|tara:strand:- start:427 stop:687 length:261 start_codon:yes stop_codon:yes gene_type:complete